MLLYKDTNLRANHNTDQVLYFFISVYVVVQRY